MNNHHQYRTWQLLAAATTPCLLMINFASGVIVSPHSVSHPIVYRDIGAALALPCVGGFCFFVLPIVLRKARLAILGTALSTNSDHAVATEYADKISALPRRHAPWSVALASIIMFVYFTTEGLFYVSELGFEANIKRFPLIFQAVFMWTAIVMGIAIVFRITTLVADYVEMHLKVELFSAEELFPIANTVFWNVLFFAFGLSLVPLFWLGGEPVLKDFVMAMIVFLIMTNLMFYPLLRVRSIIIARKAEALDAFRQAKNYARTSPHQSAGIKELGLEGVTKLRSANVKDEIVKAREWPVSLHLAIRFGLILLLPAVSWAGSFLLARLVEMLPN